VGVCPLFVFEALAGRDAPGRGVVAEPHGDEQLARIRSTAERVARSHGVELFDIKFRRESVGWVLRVVIDRPPPADPGQPEPPEASIGIAECQRVSQDLSAVLDVEDTIEHAYTLEVSSPGLDRPLRHAGDYRRFAGRLAKIVAAADIDGQRHFAGRLKGLEGETVVLEEGRRTHRIPLAAISRARLDVEF
jgi:ribosome maturation factor RimP